MYFTTFFLCGLSEISRAQNEPKEKIPDLTLQGYFIPSLGTTKTLPVVQTHFQLGDMAVFLHVLGDRAVSLYPFIALHFLWLQFKP